MDETVNIQMSKEGQYEINSSSIIKEEEFVDEQYSGENVTKAITTERKVEDDAAKETESSPQERREVKRKLKQRHIGMIALGGTIGTGLIIGIGPPLAHAGPVGALISYLFMGTVIYSVTQSLGEMATFIPVTSSFSVFAQRFLSPALGATNGYMYWLSWCFTFALELSVLGKVIQYWTEAVPLAAWIVIFWCLLTSMNMFPVKYYGEFEFCIASIKVIALLGFIIFSFCVVCGAGQSDGPIGFRYWRNPGAWGPGIISSDKNEGRFLGWVSSLINAAFTYQGTELVGITAGEAANPRKALPRAIKKVVVRILVFYILSLFFIGLLVPYNDPKLDSDGIFVSSSPFMISIENSGTKVLPDIFNAVVLITILSAGNSNVYIGSRVLYSLSKNSLAPRFLSNVTRGGVPYFSVLSTSVFGFLAFLEVSAGSGKAFNWLLNITGVAGFFAWLLISFSHIRFMQAIRKRGISRDDLPYKAQMMPFLAYYASFFIALIVLIQGFTAFAPTFQPIDFVAAYISIFLFLAIWLSFQVWFKCRLLWKLQDIDIDSDRRQIEELVWIEPECRTRWQRVWDVLS
ncbi:Alp1p [Saccharomyces cerevisiae YJM1304]|nr:Alp1p [Saccharomyces cerevisiae YJM1304]CAI4749720.1 CRL_G0046560.mRNA.1.CDS.1 [Saccharomyces cerevisiae]CAI7446761.1 CRL_G0046560.mRNA.1.CDS.1 [Saccharomyces cerevisiae]